MWLKSPCKEMMSLQLIGDGLPERLHPKSFRSSFEVDTNIWASRDARFIPYLQVSGHSKAVSSSASSTWEGCLILLGPRSLPSVDCWTSLPHCYMSAHVCFYDQYSRVYANSKQ